MSGFPDLPSVRLARKGVAPSVSKGNLMEHRSRRRSLPHGRVSRTRRYAVLVAAAATLASTVTSGVAQAKDFVIPAKASPFAASYKIGTSAYFQANAAIDAAGTAHLAWQAPGANSLISCTLPLGARKCATQVSLPLVHSDNNAYGFTMVLLPSPGTVEIVADECCQLDPQMQITEWRSTDGGHTFAPPVSVGNLPGLVDAVADNGQLVLFKPELDGLHEQVTPADGSSPSTTDMVVSADTGNDLATVIPGGGLLVAHETQLFSTTIKDTTSVSLQTAPAAAPATVGSFPGEDLISMTSGGGNSYLMTRVISNTGVLDPPVRIRHWNGTGFDAPRTLPVPGSGEASRFALTVDPMGRLHAVWLGARENYRLWHSVSTNGGRTWHATLLGDAALMAAVYPVVDAAGVGVALELTAGTGPVVIQPLLITPHVAFSITPRRVVPGATSTFAGRVSPAVFGKVVLIQRHQGSHWVTVASTREKRNGAFTVRVPQTRLGVTSYRAYVNGQYGTYDIAASGNVTVNVHRS
jgi:hypothetical protein